MVNHRGWIWVERLRSRKKQDLVDQQPYKDWQK